MTIARPAAILLLALTLGTAGAPTGQDLPHEIAELEFLLGTWLYEGHSVQPDRETRFVSGTVSIDVVLTGVWTGIEQHHSTETPYSLANGAVSQHLYDSDRAQWFSTSTPAYPAIAWPEHTTLDRADDVLEMPARANSDVTGDHLQRARYKNITPTDWEWVVERSYDSGASWFAIQRVHAKRLGSTYATTHRPAPRPAGARVRTVLGGFEGSRDVAIDPTGNVYLGGRFAPGSDLVIVRVAPDGTSDVIAEGLEPAGLAYADGHLYVHAHDREGGRIVRLDGNGAVEHIADAPGDALAVDAEGNAYTIEWNSGQVLKIQPDGTVDVLIDQPVLQGSLGLAFDDRRGQLYIADWVSGEIHAVDAATGEFRLLTIVRGQRGSNIAWLAMADDSLYATGFGAERIFRIRLPDGEVDWVAGSGFPGADDGAATSARFRAPNGIAVSADGALVYVAELGDMAGGIFPNNRLRVIEMRTH